MQKEEVRAELTREPFVPLRLHPKDGKTFDIPFRDVAHMLGYGVLVFIGLEESTHQTKSHDRFSFENIVRIEHRPKRGTDRRRTKAS